MSNGQFSKRILTTLPRNTAEASFRRSSVDFDSLHSHTPVLSALTQSEKGKVLTTNISPNAYVSLRRIIR